MKSKVFKLAHKIKNQFNTWSEALTAAWKKVKIVKSLQNGVFSFMFIKKNGEVRKAIGTLDASFYDVTNIKNSYKSKWNIQKYFDIEKKAWRCFDILRFIK